MQHNPTHDEEDLQKPDQIPSPLTARELQARDPAKGANRNIPGADLASLAGSKGEPAMKKGPGRKPKA